MSEPKTAGVTDPKPATVDGKKPEDVTISEGLSKIFEAGEELTPEQIDAMAEQSKNAAKQSQDARDNKNAQIESGKDH